MSEKRCIRLRRPPVLVPAEGPFVPEGASIDEVERRWQALCEVNSRYHDGRLWHVVGVHRNGYGGAVIHVIECAYRYYAVQHDGFDAGCRALGTKGLTTRDEKSLLGRRAATVSAYQGMWEFAPGGAIEPGQDPADVVAGELEEEASLRAAGAPTAVAIMYDNVLRSWELVYRVTPEPGEARATVDEYDEVRWCAPDALPAPLSPVSEQIAEMLRTT